MTGRDAEREQLAAALAPKLRESYGGYLPRPASAADWLSDADWAVDALLPVVDRIANERGAVPNPRFRDQLAEAAAEHFPRHERFERSWGSGWKYVGCTCGWDKDGRSFAYHAADALMPTIAAEMEARVQAAANQRAAAELRAMARDIRYTTVLGHIAERLDVRADELDPS